MVKSDSTSINSCLVRKLTALLLIVAVILSVCSCRKSDSDFDGKRFGKTRQITVLVEKWEPFDADVNESAVARFIHDSVLKDCNIDVRFLPSDKYYRLDRGIGADINVDQNWSIINTYYKQNGVMNIAPLLGQYGSFLTDLTSFYGDDLYYCSSSPSEVWYLAPRDFTPDAQVTFVRSDWLNKLGLDAPSDIDELHNVLVAFRDNAELLLGSDSANLIPFFIDSEPNISAKPLFDSYLDASISPEEYYYHGHCRVTQPGYVNGLKTLNHWYLEGLLPSDFENIRPFTKESYEPIENGYVGAFCAPCDYLYIGGENSHISVLRKNCGEDADYVAVNTFKNAEGEYTCWNEDYLTKTRDYVYLPSTCSDPLACLVYLNWLCDKDNIAAVRDVSLSNTDPNDPYTFEKYLITCKDLCSDCFVEAYPDAEAARQVAMDVKNIHMGSVCIGFTSDFFKHVNADRPISELYPSSTRIYVSSVIRADEGEFDVINTELYEEYCSCGADSMLYLHNKEWNKIIVEGDMHPW